jgi:hypothetical protein
VLSALGVHFLIFDGVIKVQRLEIAAPSAVELGRTRLRAQPLIPNS